MDKPDWGPRLVAVIAGEIRRWRDRRDMSAQALSNRCAELGWPIQRSVLSNLESGYRETITVPELFVLSLALEVPALALLVPLGEAETIEVAPGKTVSTTDALRWLRGDAPLPGTLWDGRQDGSQLVASFQVHYDNVMRVPGYRRLAADARAEAAGLDGPAAEELLRVADGYERESERHAQMLRNFRVTMRARGLTPPALPPELAFIDDLASS
jgi:transcriptional regulator with XRE-family HTH domain